MTSWQVCLLRCSDGSLYFGITTDLKRRVNEHNKGIGSRYTKSRLPVRLVWSSKQLNKSEAFKEEYRVKKLSKVLKERMVAEGEEFS
jgi:putative endonuclease